MCGLFGYLGLPRTDAEVALAFKFVQGLAITSHIRGKDATGFAAIFPEDAGLMVDKRPIASNQFIAVSNSWQMLRHYWPTVLVGHCRQTTSGDPKRGRNNHPFSSKRYSLVHNGKVEKHEELASRRNIKLRTDTDSEILIHIMEKHPNPFDGIREFAGFDGIQIATAVLKHGEPKAQKLFLFRNKERPLWTAFSAKLNTLFFASTRDIIEATLTNIFKLTVAEGLRELGLELAEFPENYAAEWGFENNKPVPGLSASIPPPLPPLKKNSTVANKHVEDCFPGKTCDTTTAPAPAPTTIVKPLALDISKDIPEIVKLLREKPYMEDKEYEHFKAWKAFYADHRN